MPFSFYEQRLEKIKKDNCFRKINNISHKSGKFIFIDGHPCLNLSSNDYLGLSTNQKLVTEFLSRAQGHPEFLFSATSARLLSGSSRVYGRLEEELASLFQKKAGLIFNTGYQCNLGVIASLAQKGDVIFSDKLNHASIVAGIRLSNADCYRYRHLDTFHLEFLLKKYRAKYRQAIIVSESVFSMDGDVADIVKLVALKKEHNALLMVDEAHAFGVFGEKLCGLCEEQAVLPDVDIIVATFGKSMASMGAFCVSDQVLIDYLINKAGPFIFSTAIPPINILWTIFLLTQKYCFLQQMKRQLTQLFTQVHQRIPTGSKSQIIPVIIGNSEKTIAIAKALQDQGFFVPPIRTPTVPVGTARLRLSLTAEMTFDEVSTALNAIEKEL